MKRKELIEFVQTEGKKFNESHELYPYYLMHKLSDLMQEHLIELIDLEPSYVAVKFASQLHNPNVEYDVKYTFNRMINVWEDEDIDGEEEC